MDENRVVMSDNEDEDEKSFKEFNPHILTIAKHLCDQYPTEFTSLEDGAITRVSNLVEEEVFDWVNQIQSYTTSRNSPIIDELRNEAGNDPIFCQMLWAFQCLFAEMMRYVYEKMKTRESENKNN